MTRRGAFRSQASAPFTVRQGQATPALVVVEAIGLGFRRRRSDRRHGEAVSSGFLVCPTTMTDWRCSAAKVRRPTLAAAAGRA